MPTANPFSINKLTCQLSRDDTKASISHMRPPIGMFCPSQLLQGPLETEHGSRMVLMYSSSHRGSQCNSDSPHMPDGMMPRVVRSAERAIRRPFFRAQREQHISSFGPMISKSLELCQLFIFLFRQVLMSFEIL